MHEPLVQVTLANNKPILTSQVQFDFNTVSVQQGYQNGPQSLDFFFTYRDLTNPYSVNIELVSEDLEVTSIDFQPNQVQVGDAVRITNIEILNFPNINGSYDNQFTASDPNRLADLFFRFGKETVNPFNGNEGVDPWFDSTVLSNQGNLQFDFSNANIYVGRDITISLVLIDEDDNGQEEIISSDTQPISIDFSAYVNSQPSSIVINELGVELVFTLQW